MIAIFRHHRVDHHRVAGQPFFHDALGQRRRRHRRATAGRLVSLAWSRARNNVPARHPVARFRRSRLLPSLPRNAHVQLAAGNHFFTRGRSSGKRLAPRMWFALPRWRRDRRSRRASASTSSRVALGSSSVSSASCRLLSVSLFGPKLLNPPAATLFQQLDFQMRPVQLSLQFGDAQRERRSQGKFYITRAD